MQHRMIAMKIRRSPFRGKLSRPTMGHKDLGRNDSEANAVSRSDGADHATGMLGQNLWLSIHRWDRSRIAVRRRPWPTASALNLPVTRQRRVSV